MKKARTVTPMNTKLDRALAELAEMRTQLGTYVQAQREMEETLHAMQAGRRLSDGGERVDEEPIDMINHPPHYRRGGLECLDVIEKLDWGYHLGNMLKYVWRAGRKDPMTELEDLKKGRFYLNRHIAAVTVRERRRDQDG